MFIYHPRKPIQRQMGSNGQGLGKQSYPRQKWPQANNPKYLEGQGLKERGVVSVRQQYCPLKE